MQSPPARAEATRVSILSPVLARPGRAAEIEVMVYEFPQAQVLGESGRQEQAGIGHQTVVVKDDANTVGVVALVASIGCSFSGVGFLLQNHYPRCKGALSYPFTTPRRSISSVDWGLGIRARSTPYIPVVMTKVHSYRVS